MTSYFFIVGAQRSGTTYLYRLLDQHPAIEMAKPMRPEPKFFLRQDLDQRSQRKYLATFFSEETPVRGEKSTSYIESENAARSISEWFPDAKIIFLLRNPIERAISNYKFSRQHDVETLPMKDAFMQEAARRDTYDHSRFSTSPYAYLARGRYIDYIRTYERYFPRDNLLIYLFEELVGSHDMVQSIYKSLSVDSTFVPDGLKSIINASDDQSTVNMSESLQTYLADFFAEPNDELAGYLGRSLSVWSQGMQPSMGQHGKNE